MIVVGPTPPPLGGFSYITGRMLSRLRAERPVLLLNRSHRPGPGRLPPAVSIAWSTTCLLGLLLTHLVAGKGGPLYLALSGGKGQWLDLAFLAIARLFRLRVFLHHHSFAYLDRASRSASIVFKVSGPAQHIVLCDRMAKLLVERYGLPSSRICVISNAAFLQIAIPPAPVASSTVADSNIAPLVIGFLGNITAEKGIFEYIDVVAGMEGTPSEVRGVIAGPVHPTIRARFNEALAKSESIRYIGPVYERAKDDFLDSIDVLLFPSRYENEAEPVTLLEALAHNAYVLTTDRGCCGSMIESSAAGVVIAEAQFVAVARSTLGDTDRLRSHIRARGPVREFQRIQMRGQKRLDALLKRIAL